MSALILTNLQAQAVKAALDADVLDGNLIWPDSPRGFVTVRFHPTPTVAVKVAAMGRLCRGPYVELYTSAAEFTNAYTFLL